MLLPKWHPENAPGLLNGDTHTRTMKYRAFQFGSYLNVMTKTTRGKKQNTMADKQVCEY